MVVKLVEKHAIKIVLTIAFFVRLTFAVSIPAWQSPDEFPHYWVMKEIKSKNELPASLPYFPSYEAFQPPIYYLLGSVLLLPFDESLKVNETIESPPLQLFWIRLFSVLFGMCFLLVSYRMLQNIKGLTSDQIMLAMIILSFLPTLCGVQATINNDAPVILSSSVSLYFLLKQNQNIRNIVWSAVWAGISFLIKTSAIMLPLVFIFHMLIFSEQKTRVKPLLLYFGVFTVFSCLLGLRNLYQYHELLGINPGEQMGWSFSVNQIIWAVRNLSWSFIFAFGKYYQIHLPALVYLIIAVSSVLMMIYGWVKAFRSVRRYFYFSLMSIISGLTLSLIYTVMYPVGVMTSWGKNLYPLLPVISVFISVGLLGSANKLLKSSAVLLIVGVILLGLNFLAEIEILRMTH